MKRNRNDRTTNSSEAMNSKQKGKKDPHSYGFISHKKILKKFQSERIETQTMTRIMQHSNYNVSVCGPAVWIDAKDVDQLMLASSSFHDQSSHYNLPRCPSSPSSKKRIKKDNEYSSPTHISECIQTEQTIKDIGLRRVSKRLSKLFDDVDDDSEDDDKSLEHMVYSDDESSIEDEDLYDVDSSSGEVCQVAILERIRQFSQLLFPRRDMMEIGDYK